MARIYAAYDRNVTQLGREATPGAVAAATTIWRGPFAMLEDTENQQVLEENVGSRYPAAHIYSTMYGGRLSMQEAPLTFEQIMHIWDAGWMDAAPTGTTTFVRTYVDDPNTTQTIRTYTIETGNLDASADNQRMSYAFVEEWQISAEAGREWTMSATWIGRRVSANPLTPALAVPQVQVAVLPMTKLYLDSATGTVGTTQMSGVLMAASIKRTTGWRAVPVGDGSRLFAGIKQLMPETTFSLTIELEQDAGVSLVASERAAWRSRTSRQFRLAIDGDDADHKLRIDWSGYYTAIGAYENADGNTTVTLEGAMTYNAAKNLFMTAVLTNQVADLDA